MPPKADPFSTKLHRRVDAILLVITIVVIVLVVRASAHGQTLAHRGAVTLSDDTTSPSNNGASASALQGNLDLSGSFAPERRNDLAELAPDSKGPKGRTSGSAGTALTPVKAVASSESNGGNDSLPRGGVNAMQLGAASLLGGSGGSDVAALVAEDAAAVRAAKARITYDSDGAGQSSA